MNKRRIKPKNIAPLSQIHSLSEFLILSNELETLMKQLQQYEDIQSASQMMSQVSEYVFGIMKCKEKYDLMYQELMQTYKIAQSSGKIHGVVPSTDELDLIKAARVKNSEVSKANDQITSL